MNNNGRTPTSMQVLRLNQTIGPVIGVFKSDDGIHWMRVTEGPVQDSLEDTVAKLRLQHAIHSPNAWIRVVNMKTGDVLHNQAPEVPHKEIAQFFPEMNDEERDRKRSEWLERVLMWILPPEFHERARDQKKGKVLARWFKKHKIEVQTRSDGAVRVMRKGESIAEWLV